MAAKNSTLRAPRNSKTRLGSARKDRSSSSEGSQATAFEVPRALHCAIEAERSRLMRADAILHCAVLAMDEQGCPKIDAPDYQAIINTARDMINLTIGQLDLVSLHTVLRYVKTAAEECDAEGGPASATKREVREPAGVYLH